MMTTENSFCNFRNQSGLSTIKERDTECLKHTYNETVYLNTNEKIMPSSKKRISEIRNSFEKQDDLDQIRELPENSSSNRESSYKKLDKCFENSQKISQSDLKMSKTRGISGFNKHK